MKRNCGLNIVKGSLTTVSLSDNDTLCPKRIGDIAIRVFFNDHFDLYCVIVYGSREKKCALVRSHYKPSFGSVLSKNIAAAIAIEIEQFREYLVGMLGAHHEAHVVYAINSDGHWPLPVG